MQASRSPADEPALLLRALRWTSLFAGWPERAIDRVASIARLERYDKRTQVLGQDRKRREVLVVVSGCLEVSRVSSDGAKFLLSLLGAGEVVGLVRLLQSVRLPYDYHAHHDTVLVHLPSDEFCAVLDADPILWRDIALLVLSRQRDSITSMQQRALGGLQQSLAETLVKLTAWYGESVGESKSVRLRISQSDLASMLGVSRQTMNKELRELSTLGLVAVDYGQLVVRDMQGLRGIAERVA